MKRYIYIFHILLLLGGTLSAQAQTQNDITWIAIRPIIIRRPVLGAAISAEKIQKQISFLNNAFRKSQIQFYISSQIYYDVDLADSEGLYDFTTTSDMSIDFNKFKNKGLTSENAINVVFVNSLVVYINDKNEKGAGGAVPSFGDNTFQSEFIKLKSDTELIYPASNGDKSILKDSFFNLVFIGQDKGSTLAHEMGHYFGLFHTFETLKSFGSSCLFAEVPLNDGNNINKGELYRGDFIEDTPADYKPSDLDYLQELANLSLSKTSDCYPNKTIAPDNTNIMSYWLKNSKFSTQQLNRAKNFGLALRGHIDNQYSIIYEKKFTAPPSIPLTVKPTLVYVKKTSFQNYVYTSLKWESVNSAIGYIIERSTEASFNDLSKIEIIAGTTNVSYADLTSNNFYYRVRPTNGITYSDVKNNFQSGITLTTTSNPTAPSSNGRLAATSAVNYCPGTSFDVNFELNGDFTENTLFNVELSDATGNFTNPELIGTGELSPVRATIPLRVYPANTQYRLRVVSTNPTIISDTTSTFSIDVSTPVPSITASKSSVTAGEAVNFTAGGCTGTVYWSVGQSGVNPISVNIYEDKTVFAGCAINGCSSNPVSTTVTVPNNTLPKINLIEYYVDTDPGVGNGLQIIPNPLEVDISRSLNIPTSNISAGTHQLCFRVRDTQGRWSAVQCQPINVKGKIVTNVLASNAFCPSGTIQVPFTKTGTYNANNQFIVQLSDASGQNFVNLTTTGSSSPLTATLPAALAGGSGYRVRVVSTSPEVVGKTSPTNVSILEKPTVAIAGGRNIQSGDLTELSVSFTGTPPYSFTYNGTTVSAITENPYRLFVSPITTTTYSLSSTSNACGEGSTVSGQGSTTLSVTDITLPNVAASYNVGQSISVPFTTVGSFNTGNVFNVYLSDANADFSSGVLVGSGTSSPINVTLPNSLPFGTMYRLQVRATDPTTNSNESNDFTISNPRSIALGSTTASMINNSAYSQTFTPTGTFNSGNTYRLVLSNQNGDFSSGTTLLATGSSTTFAFTIPDTTKPSIQYRFRVESTNPIIYSNPSSYVAIQKAFLTTDIQPGLTKCEGSTFAIAALSNLTFASGAIYTAQLSDVNGGFATPTSIGSGTNPSAINLTLPTNLTGGSNYKIRLVVNNPSTTGSESFPISILDTPTIPTISSPVINPGQTAILTATGCNGTVNWYSLNSGGTSIGIGTTFTTPTLTKSTNYYADCSNGTCINQFRASKRVFVAGENPCFSGTLILTTPVNGVWQAQQINSSSNVLDLTNLYAEKSVNLNPGFSAGPNEKFMAQIVPCQNNLPNPVIEQTGTNTFTSNGLTYKSYTFKVNNATSYHEELFNASPSLPACGTNTSASRTWLTFYDANTGVAKTGYCAITSTAGLNNITITRLLSDTSLTKVYIGMQDRLLNLWYYSNIITLSE